MKSLFSKKTANDFEKLISIIEDVDENIKESFFIKTKRELDQEWIGYNILLDRKDRDVFFGMWLALWKAKGSPLMIAISDESKDFIRVKDNFKTYFLKHKKYFCDFRMYEDRYCFTFTYDFI